MKYQPKAAKRTVPIEEAPDAPTGHPVVLFPKETVIQEVSAIPVEPLETRLPAALPGDDNPALRPRRIAEFVGQSEAMANISIYIAAARQRNEALDHILLYGPPGLGKTTIANIVAEEMGSSLRVVTGPALQKAGDVAGLLTSLDHGDILFIDEIHRLHPAVEEMLYPAMEDFRLDLIVGEGVRAKSVSLELSPFTLIGATTSPGSLSNPLRDRFGIPVELNYYSATELKDIVARAAHLLNISISHDGAEEIARRARGTPRIANRLLRRIRDFATIENAGLVDAMIADLALARLDIDCLGLDNLDRRYLDFIRINHNGGPVGIETIAAALSQSRETLEDVVEPYLLKSGLLQRTSRGRIAIIPRTTATTEYGQDTHSDLVQPKIQGLGN